MGAELSISTQEQNHHYVYFIKLGTRQNIRIENNMSQDNVEKHGASRFLGQSFLKRNKGDQFKENWKAALCRHEKDARSIWNKLRNFRIFFLYDQT